ncbi:MAG: GMC family oxidoreductase [bacterium]
MISENGYSNQSWDVVIIGTGFGGSMAARQLAAAGMRVLLLERGDWVARDDSAWDVKQILIDRKYKTKTAFEADQWLGRRLVHPDMAVGGNSIFYGAASLRLRERDFCAKSAFIDVAKDCLSFVDWPIKYDHLEPYYDLAEQLLDVAGQAQIDPFEPRRRQPFPQESPPYSRPAQRIVDAAKNIGLNPFPLPLAINYRRNSQREKCIQCTTCDLFPCKIGAKNDLAMTVLPEARKNGAVVQPHTIAKKLLRKNHRISGVECLDALSGERFVIRCGLCVVACGAIGSAKLLLLSGLDETKYNGDWIGRNLLRHCNGIVIGMFPFETNLKNEFNKQVAVTDFYDGHPDGKGLKGPWGMLQALQVPPQEYIHSQAPVPISTIGARTTKFHSYLLCIAEDLPNPENRVTIHPTKKDQYGLPNASVYSKYHQRDLQARKSLYREAARILRKAGAMIHIRKPINTYSHAIGTCRFGHSPEAGVLDPSCQFFGIKNLFVVDGSFMPTAGGVNPSLTIAANALRVGDYIVENWQAFVGERREKLGVESEE